MKKDAPGQCGHFALLGSPIARDPKAIQLITCARTPVRRVPCCGGSGRAKGLEGARAKRVLFCGGSGQARGLERARAKRVLFCGGIGQAVFARAEREREGTRARTTSSLARAERERDASTRAINLFACASRAGERSEHAREQPLRLCEQSGIEKRTQSLLLRSLRSPPQNLLSCARFAPHPTISSLAPASLPLPTTSTLALASHARPRRTPPQQPLLLRSPQLTPRRTGARP
jgi:hypothetical protein